MKLQRPLVFLDLETTGLDKENDRIVQMALIKLKPDMTTIEKGILCNPMKDIPEQATAVHGITNEMVARMPQFSFFAKGIHDFIQGCDIGGFNAIFYDLPLLRKELSRSGIAWDFRQHHMVDPGNIFKIKQPRTLGAALQHYCKKDLEGAHDAMADTKATLDVFLAQMEQHSDLPQDIEALAKYSNYGRKIADLSGRFYYDENDLLRFNFGKHKDEVAQDQISFLEWMVYKADFPRDTCEIALDILSNDNQL